MKGGLQPTHRKLYVCESVRGEKNQRVFVDRENTHTRLLRVWSGLARLEVEEGLWGM